MAPSDPDPDATNTSILEQEGQTQPFARRSVRMFFTLILILFCAGLFAGWFFFGLSGDQNTPQNYVPQETAATQMPGNEYGQGSGRGAVYNFFYKIFGGIEDGLDDSPHNLKNVEHIDKFNIETTTTNDAAAALAIDRYAQARAAQIDAMTQDEYRHSVLDVIGSEVFGRTGDKAGTIEDILVHKETGKAKLVVIDEDEARYERDMAGVGFKKIRKQQADGDVLLTVAEEKIEQKPDFEYSSIGDKNYVSLRRLRDGQLLDFEGEVAGQIDAVIYENAEAQNIYFTLRPQLARQGISLFYLPFEETQIIENIDGLDIKLTEQQTKALAEMLFTGQ